MSPADEARIVAEIERLNVEYWYEVDRHDGARAHEFFVEDGTYTTSVRSRTGHAAIAEFYRGRQDGRVRTARHVIANQRVTVHDERNASGDWVLLLYAADGAPPLPLEPPILIADVHDVCSRGADGRWRYVSRTISAVFKGDKPTTG